MKAGWEVKTLGEVTVLENGDRGKNYPGRKAFVTSGVPFINAGHISDGKIDWAEMNYIPEEHFQRLSRGKITKDDLLFCLRGSLGKFGHVTEDVMGAIASSLVIIRATSKIDVNFLKQFLGSAACAEEIEKYAAGAAQPNLGATDLKKFKIPLPPLAEQKRIVSILDEAFEGLDRARENAEANLKSARELFEVSFSKVLQVFVDTSCVQSLKDVAELIVDCEHKTAPLASEGYPSVRTPNIGPGFLIMDGVNYVSQETYERWTKRARPAPGDLILAREAPAGNVGVIPQGVDVCLGQRTVLIRPIPDVAPQFLADFLMHPTIQKKLLSKSTGATVQHINMRDIRGLPMPVLPQKDIQISLTTQISNLRERIDSLTSGLETKLQDISDLRQSLLQKAFAGELT